MRAWNALQGQVERVPAQLAPWTARPFPIQACLCDIWRANVLFEGETVSGIIDYGGVKYDHVAVDLARLLGSMVEDNAALRVLGLEAYRSIRPLSPGEEELTTALDKTGTLLAAANWLRWLYQEQERFFEDRAAVAGRLAALVQRIERWDS
jgi:Ser/Thr protein kinase RdoA (MazF antagonist)